MSGRRGGGRARLEVRREVGVFVVVVVEPVAAEGRKRHVVGAPCRVAENDSWKHSRSLAARDKALSASSPRMLRSSS